MKNVNPLSNNYVTLIENFDTFYDKIVHKNYLYIPRRRHRGLYFFLRGAPFFIVYPPGIMYNPPCLYTPVIQWDDWEHFWRYLTISHKGANDLIQTLFPVICHSLFHIAQFPVRAPNCISIDPLLVYEAPPVNLLSRAINRWKFVTYYTNLIFIKT